jgi:hypothetical protein
LAAEREREEDENKAGLGVGIRKDGGGVKRSGEEQGVRA